MNCYDCKHLEQFAENECYEGQPEQYGCQKRKYRNSSEESKHFDQMDSHEYRMAHKRCAEKGTK